MWDRLGRGGYDFTNLFASSMKPCKIREGEAGERKFALPLSLNDRRAAKRVELAGIPIGVGELISTTVQ